MIRRHLPLLFLALTLSGCGGARKPIRAVLGRPTQLTILPIVDSNANAGSSIDVEIVTALDQPTLDRLLAFTSQTWFQSRQDFLRLNAAHLHGDHYEWVPGQSVPPITIPSTRSASGVVLFANYSSPGSHATVLPLAATLRLQLNATDLAIQILP